MFEPPASLVDGDWMPPLVEVPDWLDAPVAETDAWTDADALTVAVTRPTGVGLLAELLQVDPAGLSADEAVTFAQQVARVSAFIAGVEARALAGVEARLVTHAEAERVASAERARGFVTAEMLASAELAAALRVSPRAMDRHLDHARDLDGPMRPLRDALDTGTISAAHAAVIARELTRLPAAGDASRAGDHAKQCARILAIVIPYAAAHTAGQSARKTRSLVLAVDPVGADARRRDAAEHDHGVWLTPTDAGTCELTAVLPLAHGAAVMDAITTLAHDPRFETGDGCLTIGQRRVAALVTLVLGDPGSVATVTGPVAEARSPRT
jgi:hypothetical protein